MPTTLQTFVHDILIGFVEDFGTNSWRQIETWHYDEANIANAYAIVHELDDDGGTAQKLRVDERIIRNGLAAIMNHEFKMSSELRSNIVRAHRDRDAGMIDAYDADLIVQAGLFGNLIYG